MKGLKTLIKIHQNKIDQIGVDIKELEEQKAQHLKLIEKLEVDLKSEIDAFAHVLEFTLALEKYKSNVNNQKSLYNNKIIEIEKKLVDLKESLRVEFNSLKKFEHVFTSRVKKEKIEKEKKEEAEIADNIIMKYNHQ